MPSDVLNMFMKEILIFDGDEKGRYMKKIICLLYQSCLSKIGYDIAKSK